MSPFLLLTLGLIVLLGALMGFRDAPNAVALPVRFRALAPRVALLMAALLNAVGALLGMAMAALGIAFVSAASSGSLGGAAVASAAVVVTIAWGLLLWWLRIPGSTTHALLASIAGAHVASHLVLGTPLDPGVGRHLWGEVAVGLLLSPLLAWGVTRLATPWVVRLGTTGTTVTVQHRARITLAVSAGATALGHGVQTGQRLGLLWGLAVLGRGDGGPGLPAPGVGSLDLGALFWTCAAIASASVAVGTLGGAWRIAWTLTERLVRLDPLRAAVAGAVPAVLLFLGSFLLHLPLSSTHTVTASIVGAGQTQTYASVRWAQVLRVVLWWVLTPVLCAVAAAALFAAVNAAVPLPS